MAHAFLTGTHSGAAGSSPDSSLCISFSSSEVLFGLSPNSSQLPRLPAPVGQSQWAMTERREGTRILYQTLSFLLLPESRQEPCRASVAS